MANEAKKVNRKQMLDLLFKMIPYSKYKYTVDEALQIMNKFIEGFREVGLEREFSEFVHQRNLTNFLCVLFERKFSPYRITRCERSRDHILSAPAVKKDLEDLTSMREQIEYVRVDMVQFILEHSEDEVDIINNLGKVEEIAVQVFSEGEKKFIVECPQLLKNRICQLYLYCGLNPALEDMQDFDFRYKICLQRIKATDFSSEESLTELVDFVVLDIKQKIVAKTSQERVKLLEEDNNLALAAESDEAPTAQEKSRDLEETLDGKVDSVRERLGRLEELKEEEKALLMRLAEIRAEEVALVADLVNRKK